MTPWKFFIVLSIFPAPPAPQPQPPSQPQPQPAAAPTGVVPDEPPKPFSPPAWCKADSGAIPDIYKLVQEAATRFVFYFFQLTIVVLSLFFLYQKLVYKSIVW